MRGWIVAGAACAAWLSASPSTAHGQTPAEAGAAQVLREAAQTGVLTGLRWPRFPYYRDELTKLYSASGWRPVWTTNGQPTAEARSAIDVLRSAEDRGLHPEDYDAALLDQQFRKLASTSAASSASDIGWFDVALSVGLLRHVSDVHIGRVNPRMLSVVINVEQKKLDLARELGDAIARNRIADMVRNAEPNFTQYRNLKSAYARYRALAADTTLPTVAVSRTLHPGEPFDQVAELRRRLAAFGDLAGNAVGGPGTTYDAVTAAAVARFQERHGLGADSVLGPATVAAINVSPARRARQLELALERIRWLPPFGSSPFIVANVPSFQLYAFDSVGGTGAPAVQMNVVVGKANVGRETPLFERNMEYIIFRPYWVIPPGILRSETLPAVRRDRGYLARNDMEIYSGDGDSGPALPTTGENIARVAGGDLGIRQRPGPRNSLGLAKFIFPNDHNVYFHGTPATELFSHSRRDFSHGCIRLEDPAGLATWVLRDPRQWSRRQVEAVMNGDRSRRVILTREMPVVVYYTTAVVRPDGKVNFLEDVYKHDAKLERALAKGYPFAP